VIRITRAVAIGGRAIVESFVRSSGPGGQNVNKVATAMQLRFDPTSPGYHRSRLVALARRRVTQRGEILITAQRFRTQERDRPAALDTLIRLVERATEPPLPRIAIRLAAASKRRRLEAKAHRPRVKEDRRARGEE